MASDTMRGFVNGRIIACRTTKSRRRRAAQGAARDPECRGRRPAARRARAPAQARLVRAGRGGRPVDRAGAHLSRQPDAARARGAMRSPATTSRLLSLRLGLMSIERQPAYRAALPPAARLAEAVGLSVALSVPGVLGPTIVRIEHGGYPLHVNLHVGSVMSLDTTATGRVFRAFGDPAQLDAMAASQAGAGATLAGAEQPAPDAGVPQAELDAIRARGIERGVDLPSPGVSAMCVPVFDAQGTLQLALTVIGSTGPIDVDWDGPIAAALRDAALQATASLGAAHDAPPPASTSAPTAPARAARTSRRYEDAARDQCPRQHRRAAARAGVGGPRAAAARSRGGRRHAGREAFPHLVSLQKIGLLSRDDAGCGGGPLGQALGLIAMQRVSPTRDAEAEIAGRRHRHERRGRDARAARPHGNPPGGIGTTAAREPAGRHGDVARQYGDRTNLRGRHVRRRAGRPARQRAVRLRAAAAPVDAAFARGSRRSARTNSISHSTRRCRHRDGRRARVRSHRQHPARDRDHRLVARLSARAGQRPRAGAARRDATAVVAVRWIGG